MDTGKMKSLFMEMPLSCATLREEISFPLIPDKEIALRMFRHSIFLCLHPRPPLPASLSGLAVRSDFSYLARH